MSLLALFDVDGTLLLSDDPVAGEAFVGALRDCYPVDPPPDPVARTDHAGQTAQRIARLVLRNEGLADEAIDERLSDWCARFGERYAELLAEADTSRWRSAPGAYEALSRIEQGGIQLALLTGNPEPMARARMERLGLAAFFPEGQGAFGCDAEERIELLAITRERAGGWPAERTVEIGDTPRDVESAHAAGIRSIAVRSSRSREFPAADAVCDDLGAVADRLLSWNR
ncbi:MAG TPA: HAD family hydrolase [Gaiellaceae bacterium]|nr:HAD family hydrolase [Gaiellaceae bacterium]